jgi:hypothetical protein
MSVRLKVNPIVLAVGITRGWSSALAGVGAAVAVLTAVVEAPGEDVERLSVLALAITALIATTSVAAWWVMPIAVLGLLGLSLWRASR